MAILSFDKEFVVTDESRIRESKNKLENPTKTGVIRRDYELDKLKGIKLLKKLSSKREVLPN